MGQWKTLFEVLASRHKWETNLLSQCGTASYPLYLMLSEELITPALPSSIFGWKSQLFHERQFLSAEFLKSFHVKLSHFWGRNIENLTQGGITCISWASSIWCQVAPLKLYDIIDLVLWKLFHEGLLESRIGDQFNTERKISLHGTLIYPPTDHIAIAANYNSMNIFLMIWLKISSDKAKNLWIAITFGTAYPL